VLLNFARTPRILTLSEVFPLQPVPKVLRQRFMPPCSYWPFQSLYALNHPRRPVRRHFDFPRSLTPSTASLWPAPCEVGCFMPASVPLSGFLNPSAVSWLNLRFAALFRAATVPGTSLQSVPLARIARPSQDPLAPAVIHPRAVAHCFRRSPTVSPTPTLSRARPASPINYGHPFHRPEGQLPGRPGLEQ